MRAKLKLIHVKRPHHHKAAEFHKGQWKLPNR
ncbi:hypothetical protein ALP80_200159 [Pseudomonas savastanoi pv. fraxini]|nr:hypothetical protein ALP80_200159 [Pseudomonas savastanoi pv. fraxini]